MTRKIVIVIVTFSAVASEIWARPPRDVVNDLSKMRILRVFETVQSMPEQLRHNLAGAFGQRKLSMANPSENLRNEITRGIPVENYYPHRVSADQAIVAGPVNPSSPDRRLLFGFETQEFFYVYYQRAHPWSAACLVFAKKSRLGRPLLLWGGADLRMPPYEPTPQRLAKRILKNRLDDSKHFFW